jgi:hypothetical protein
MNDELIDEAITDEDGIYEVDYLQKEEYYLKFEAPNGYMFTMADSSNDEETDSDVTHAMGLNTTDPISFNPGDLIKHVDAGIISGLLPLSWKDFYINAEDEENFIYWSTSLEINVDYFEIERRLENENSFSSIARTKAVGYSTKVSEYQYGDSDVENDGLYYYRIKQIDKDGKFTYSDIRTVQRKSQNDIRNFPNPVVETMSIEGLDSDQTYNVKVISAGGIVTKSIVTNNIETYNIDTRDLIAGMYEIIILQNDKLIYQNRFIKVE